MRLIVTYLAIAVMTLLFISTYILAAINEYLYNERKVELLANANVTANIVSEYIKNGQDNKIEDVVARMNVAETSRIIVTDSQAKVIYDTNNFSDVRGKILIKEEIASALKGIDTANVTNEENYGVFIEGAATVLMDAEVLGAVYISENAQDTENFIQDIKWILVVISLVVCLLIGVLSWVMADIIISPIEKLTKFVSDFDLGNLDKRLEITGRDEISELGSAFNGMADRLEQMEDKRRLFVSNASHELKTPLSSIKLLSESILSMQEDNDTYISEFMNDINGEVDRLAKIVDRLLTLTKLDADADALEIKQTSINMLLDRVSRSLKPQAELKNITTEVLYDEEVYAEIDIAKMWQVIYNITDNAIKYTQEQGTVKTTLIDEGDFCRIEIEDNGIGIPEADVDKVFDRFYRVDKARSRESGGTGLGLSIVKDMVELHNGNIFVDSKEGEGTKFILVLPKKQYNAKEEKV